MKLQDIYKKLSLPRKSEEKKKTAISYFHMNHECMEDRIEGGRQRIFAHFVTNLSKTEQAFIPTFKQVIISNYSRDKNIVSKFICKAKNHLIIT